MSNCNGRKRRRCGCMRMCRGCWENFPYYTGPCPNAEGCYACTGSSQCNCNCEGNGTDNGCGACQCCQNGQNCQCCQCGQNCQNCQCGQNGQNCQTCCQNWCKNYCKDYCEAFCKNYCNACQCDDNGDDDQNGNDCECQCQCVPKCCRPRRCRRRCGFLRPCCGMFVAFLPIAIGPNGMVPLVNSRPCRNSDFDVNSGLIQLEKAGTYMATYTVKVPENLAVDTTITLNVDNGAMAPSMTRVLTEAGQTTTSYTGQAIFQADEGDTVSLRSTDAISASDSAAQPMFSMSLVRLGD